MTLRSRDLGVMPSDTAELGRQLLAAGDVYRVIGEHLADVVRDEDFADLYEPVGREAISPALLGLVTLFQFLEGVPDRAAARAVAVRLDWKYALHLPLRYAGFEFTCLHYFRQRVLAGGQAGLLFEAVLGTLTALGLVRRRGKQRTDATAVLAAVRELSALETATETLRLAVRALERADPTWAARALPASFRERHARTVPDYRLSEAERAAALREAGSDGYWLLEQLAESPAGLRELAEVQTLRTVWGQRFARDDDGQARPRDGGPDSTERVVSPHDPGARAGRKRGTGWVGEKVHVTETAEPGGPNFLTDIATENASSADVEALAGIRRRLAGRGLLPAQQVVDAGYVSGQQLAESERAGVVLLGPPLADTSPQEFKLADFRIDRAARRAICPAGQRATKWAERTERDGSRAVHIQFPAAACGACPLRARCTSGQQGRSLSLSEHYERLAARRAEATTLAFKAKLRARPAVEATLSELVRAHGLRQHRYRGEAKRHFENLLKGAACNLKRLARALAAGLGRAEPAPAGVR